ncbi:hypothetical protein RSOLAG22IIIB_03053 [Rhizoctonia solani]|uniref:2,5-diamino-6-ribosylamino-4(3H)-pyrimidinone 5'-phosphate reductase n=1 Tax=Rhizoctonia solani TaxID=456999 RepID=A0A0K6FMD5_9AGAM|nr:hypothetical protein RSOLAG22IIIB_03053 [Rhizoctonia solani]
MSYATEPPKFLRSVISARDSAPRTIEQQKRARVTLTYAQSLDAKIAGAGGLPLTISCDESMTMTHWLRTMHQGILVGVQTVLNDDPQLNVRRLPPRDTPYPCPRPVILDSYLRTPPTCKLLQNFAAGTGLAPYIIYGMPLLDFGESKEIKRRKAVLEEAGAILITGFEQDGQIDLAGALRLLKHRGIGSVMVEGGQRVISSMLTGLHTDGSPLVDALIITVAPSLIGFDGVGVLQQGKKLPSLKHIQSEQFGTDTVIASHPISPNHHPCIRHYLGPLAMASVTEITSIAQFNRILEEAAEAKKLTVIDFYSTTCRPCKAIAPSYEAFAEKYTNAVFLKCDIGAGESVADEYGITTVPAFIFLKNEIKVGQVYGAGEVNVRALEAAIQKHDTGN